tara:strand:+ start:210 stop:509 length:300 start_codon:yes stop_codon:yes gene_type:complete
MLTLYDEKPILIFKRQDDKKIRVEFCNIKMKLKPCQFHQFYNYLFNINRTLDTNSENIELIVVKENLKVIISLNDFLQLSEAMRLVMIEKFGLREALHN